jgi:1-aminocyclopropane-1-carboxylate deaminase
MIEIKQNITLHTLTSPIFNAVSVDVLRLDQIHPVVSGNKWFKLKYHIQEAKQQNKKSIATFGGAFSNHIAAAAFACKQAGFKSIGIIRGEKPNQFSPTLIAAQENNMQLHFVTRNDFKNKDFLEQQLDNNYYWINEGGYSTNGMLGASEILQTVDTTLYTHIIAACGTGTMLAGLINAALPYQKIIGISALKGHTDLANDIQSILPAEKRNRAFSILHDYHFGGYAKHPAALIEWMNELWKTENLPTDIVYTSKLLFAVKDLIEKRYFTTTNKLLIIHSGGLQGNLSLAFNTLDF